MSSIEQQATLESGPLLPLLPHKPSSRRLPSLPARSPPPQIRPGWTCETFVLPAAFPRSYPGSTKHAGEPMLDPTDAQGRRIDPKKAWDELIRPQVEAFRRPVKLDDDEELREQEQLYVAVNRYRPPKQSTGRNGGKGLTLVFSHANGFFKEVWEPTMTAMLEHLEISNHSLPVEEIWAPDCVIQGDSALLNEDIIGNVFNWADHGRDLLNFIISFIDSPSPRSPSPSSPVVLTPCADVPASLLTLDNSTPTPSGPASPSDRTYRDRHIVGIGHSLGGAATAYASTACPSLFSSIILVDPVVPFVELSSPPPTVQPLSTKALIRRQKWKSREDALEGFKKNPFFAAWDEQVLEGYVKHGMRDAKDGVVLKTPARNEALTFADPSIVAACRAALRLSSLPPSLPVHWIWADEGRSVLPESNIKHLLEKVVPHSTMSRVEGAGHLVVHEKPKVTGLLIAEFLEKTYPSLKAKL
ncbi:hypothetical protein JCM5296_007536 [Sporobolomyces johnsonii]